MTTPGGFYNDWFALSQTRAESKSVGLPSLGGTLRPHSVSLAAPGFSWFGPHGSSVCLHLHGAFSASLPLTEA